VVELQQPAAQFVELREAPAAANYGGPIVEVKAAAGNYGAPEEAAAAEVIAVREEAEEEPVANYGSPAVVRASYDAPQVNIAPLCIILQSV
jgi:hypothetical protein